MRRRAGRQVGDRGRDVTTGDEVSAPNARFQSTKTPRRLVNETDCRVEFATTNGYRVSMCGISGVELAIQDNIHETRRIAQEFRGVIASELGQERRVMK